MKLKAWLFLCIPWFIILFWFYGCAINENNQAKKKNQRVFFRPPTSAVTSPPIYKPTSTPFDFQLQKLLITPTSNICQNDLRFVKDVTVPDGSMLSPGEVIDKRWLVENRGTCNWDYRYRFILIDASGFNVPKSLALFPARSGTQAQIRILFTVPDSPGDYRAAWRAVDPNGKAFGDVIYIYFTVAEG